MPEESTKADLVTEKIDVVKELINENAQYGAFHEPAARENTRSWIAFSLIALLLVVIVCTYGMIAFGLAEINSIKEILVILIGPIVSLIGAVTGFYFGINITKSH